MTYLNGDARSLLLLLVDEDGHLRDGYSWTDLASTVVSAVNHFASRMDVVERYAPVPAKFTITGGSPGTERDLLGDPNQGGVRDYIRANAELEDELRRVREAVDAPPGVDTAEAVRLVVKDRDEIEDYLIQVRQALGTGGREATVDRARQVLAERNDLRTRLTRMSEDALDAEERSDKLWELCKRQARHYRERLRQTVEQVITDPDERAKNMADAFGQVLADHAPALEQLRQVEESEQRVADPKVGDTITYDRGDGFRTAEVTHRFPNAARVVTEKGAQWIGLDEIVHVDRRPRVWERGGAQPEEGTVVRDSQGEIWWRTGGRWWSQRCDDYDVMCTPGHKWDTLMMFGPLTEVLDGAA